MTPLERAIKIISDGNQTHFARTVNVEVDAINEGSALMSKPIPRLSQQLISFYLKKGSSCAPHFAPIIANLTKGKVTAHQLRPDVFQVSTPSKQEDKAA